ncbi:MAG TPA: LptF/LptG family permease [Chlamydiales bacterium]|nr:LptF/LptG family permease [Chlamydiales bacterium]
MIPVLWRYALQSYLRVFFLSVCTFIAVLLVSRFKEIARFAALSSDGLKTALFIVYQLPLILPMAIPISALIASLLLFQRLSRTSELTALRASGLSLRSILTPLLFTSFLLSLCNFSFTAEISPFCRRESKALLYRETSENPLLLLQRQQLVKIKDAYLNMKIKDEGKAAKDLILIAHNESNQRLSLVAARQLRISGEELLGYDVAILSHLQSEKEESFDPLIIENQASMSTAAPVLSAALKKNRPRLDPNALNLRMLQIRVADGGKLAKSARVEILRRISLSIAVFTLTLLGCVFGIEEERNPSKKGMFIALVLTLLILISYLMGKELKGYPLIAIVAFLLPHAILWTVSLLKIQRISRGFL